MCERKYFFVAACAAALGAAPAPQAVPGLKIERSKVTGLATFVTVDGGGAIAVQPAVAGGRIQPMEFLEQHGALFGVGDAARELVQTRAQADGLGQTHTSYQQVYLGVPVFSGVLKVHQAGDGSILAANGDFYPIPDGLDINPKLTVDAAAAQAVAVLGLGQPKVDHSELVIVDPGWYGDLPLGAHLAYYIILSDMTVPMREGFFVDAHRGRILDQWNLLETSRFRQVWNDVTDTWVRSEGGGPTGDFDADSAYDYSGDWYDYIYRAFGRDSYDGAGGSLTSTVHLVNPDFCPNAFGGGGQSSFCDGLAVDDVVGHEWGHSLTQFTSNLIYQNQSGQLNESFSDIWGEMIDLFNGNVAFPGAPGGTSWPTDPTYVGPGTDTPNTLRSGCAGAAELDVSAPPSISGTYRAAPARFGPALTVAGTTGNVAVPFPTTACSTITNPGAIAGKVALVYGGYCWFQWAVKKCQDAGAIGVIVANYYPGMPFNMLPMTGDVITIPSIMVSQSDGALIRSTLATDTVNATMKADSDTSVRWLRFEDLWGYPRGRDMWHPSCWFNPDTANHPYQTCDPDDNGGVHEGSSIPNHAFAMLVDGKTFNGFTVNGIGPIKAAAVWYRAGTVYLTPASIFMDAYTALNQAAQDLITTNITDPRDGVSTVLFTAADALEVDNALRAVEMNTEGLCGAWVNVLNSTPPTLCEGRSVLYSDHFESGAGGWSVFNSGPAGPPTPYNWSQVSGGLPFDRSGTVWRVNDLNSDCADGNESAVHTLTSPIIALPPTLPSPTLAFTHYVDVETLWDGGNIKISVNGGPFQPISKSAFLYNKYNDHLMSAADGNTNPMAGEEAWTGFSVAGGDWGTSLVDLSGFVSGGEFVQFRFDFGKDQCAGRLGWYVDDFEVYVCPTCGDGVWDPGEQCDDGNLTNGDGCSSSCQFEIVPPGNLLLHFEGNLQGADGESPTQASGVGFDTGVLGQGGVFPAFNQLYYPTAGNLDDQEGTLEFWIKPAWNGNDGQNHTVLINGGFGGMAFQKDGGANLKSIFNLWGAGGQPEAGVYTNVAGWQAGGWHHVAFTWSDTAKSLKVYVDGSLRASTTITIDLPPVSNVTFQVGANAGVESANAVLDELRISDFERTASEIRDSYMAGLTILDLAINPTSLKLFETWTWRGPPTLTATTNLGTISIPATSATWGISNPNVAEVDTGGQIHTLSAGTALVTATVQSAQATLDLTVVAPVRAPELETIDPYLANPGGCHLYEMPVVILRYLPTVDGTNLDVSYSPDFWALSEISLSDMEARIDKFDKRIKFMLEEGSRFRGYKEPSAATSLGYRVVAYITVYEPTPPGRVFKTTAGLSVYEPDWFQIFERFNLAHYINDVGVKEVWFWIGPVDPNYPSYDPGIHRPENLRDLPESNMSSPTSGDVSNSNRDNTDLPIYNFTYILYQQNFRRSQAEVVGHNHGHQLEQMFDHVNRQQDGNTDLWWKKFVGENDAGQWITGRCGWSHMPPNTTTHYDYYNPTTVLSDIEDWTPYGIGQQTLVNAQTWGNLNYAWPGDPIFEQKGESQWYIYWMQAMPGWGNTIPYGTAFMTNWWDFVGDWDNAVAAITPSWGLHATEPAPSLCGGAPLPESCTEDSDADTLVDVCDNCPTVSNPGQEDGDDDGVGDVCDNCALSNHNQADCQPNGIGDVCDIAYGPSLDVDPMNGVPDECEVPPPGNLLLHFDGNLLGAEGEAPTQTSGVSFDAGVLGQGAVFPVSNQLYYPTFGNLNDQEGTVEFWIKPAWNGNDGQNHTMIKSGSLGGMQVSKDGGSTLKGIFIQGGLEIVGVFLNVSAWQAGDWHHVAHTWSDSTKSLKLYVNGELRASTTFTVNLPAIDTSQLQIGALGTGEYLNAVLDELRISDVERTASEIRDSYRAGLTPPGDIVWSPATIPGPWPNNNAEATTRSLLFTVSPAVTANSGPGQDAIKVTMIDLQNPNPPNLPQNPPPDFSGYESATCAPKRCVGGDRNGLTCVAPADCTNGGTCSTVTESNGCARWVGKPGIFLESQDSGPSAGTYQAARLQCTPVYWDWVSETLSAPIAVVGAEIVPSSEYSVQAYGASCMGAEVGCTAVSPPVTMCTRRSGDVELPFNPPMTSAQPDVTDIAQLVNKFKNVTGAPVKAVAQLQPNLPELNADINALDIVAAVDGVKEKAYAYSGPCSCPSVVPCGLMSCSSVTPCVNAYGAGATCVKSCTGPGPLAGDPCINDTHCSGSGSCGAGYCRDRCGRCTP